MAEKVKPKTILVTRESLRECKAGGLSCELAGCEYEAALKFMDKHGQKCGAKEFEIREAPGGPGPHYYVRCLKPECKEEEYLSRDVNW